MLEELEIRDLGPIHHARIAPARGMTAITGETGAGKSMLLSAIRLISGGPAQSRRVGPGAQEAWAQGVFVVAEDNPAVIQPPASKGTGWYSTGDIVERDVGGFLHIRGRLKRFAKIAGEMISLEVVERNATIAAPGFAHAATMRADAAKGEALVLFTTAPELSREHLLAAAKAIGAPELSVPRVIRRVEAIPLLGSGKTDYVSLKCMAEADQAGQS